MTKKRLTLVKLIELIKLEGYRGIIDANSLLKLIMKMGIPRVVTDVRGAVRLAVEREGEDFLVTQYPTAVATETVGKVY